MRIDNPCSFGVVFDDLIEFLVGISAQTWGIGMLIELDNPWLIAFYFGPIFFQICKPSE